MTLAANTHTAPSALPLTDVNRWFPSTWDRGPNWLVWLGIISSFVAIFIKLWTPISINRIPEALYTLPFFYALYKNFHWLKKDRIIQLFFAALLWPIIAFGINYLQDPETALKYQKLDNLARLFLFVPIAWWLGGNARTLGWYLATAFGGLLVACLFDPKLGDTFRAFTNGKRIDFNILNAQHVALYFALALLGLLSLIPRLISTTQSYLSAWKPLLWVICIIICSSVVLGTQTRAAWLALLVCAILWLVQFAWQYRSKKPGRTFFISVLILATCSFYIGYQVSDRIVQRIQTEKGTIHHIVEGDWENIPYGSIGIRINTWIEAVRWISLKPITGWGGRVRQDVINQTDRFPDRVKDLYGHFHNSYIEFSLAYGLVGLCILMYPFAHLVGTVVRSHWPLPKWIQAFSFYSITLLLVMNLFESYFFFWSGIYVVTVILVLPYSGSLNRQMLSESRLVRHKHSSQG